jgi:GNAT superfamily N-acetyltransferase
MSFVVRSATTDDARGIAAVHVRAWQQAYAHLIPDDRLAALVPDDREPGWQRILAERSEEVWVGEVDGRVIGWVTAAMRDPGSHPRDRELNGLYCLAEFHGSGVGQALMDAAVGDAPAFLWSAADNPRAAAFYRRNGFRLDGTTSEYPMLGTPVAIVRWVR